MINQAEKVHQILTWILEGNSEHEIREAIRQQWPDEEAQPLIIAALDQVKTSATQSHEDVENWCFEATRYLYQKQVEIGEFAGAMRAIKQMQQISAQRTNQPAASKHVIHTHRVALGPITASNLDEHRRRIASRIVELSEDAGRPAGGR